MPPSLSIEQSDQAAAALSKLTGLIRTMRNSLHGGFSIEPSDLDPLFDYALIELDVLKAIFKELDSDRAEGMPEKSPEQTFAERTKSILSAVKTDIQEAASGQS